MPLLDDFQFIFLEGCDRRCLLGIPPGHILEHLLDLIAYTPEQGSYR
jgi:hypothetical protein